MTKEYRIDLKVRNNLILKRIEQLGYDSVRDFCKKEKISYINLLNLINMTDSVFTVDGEIREFVINVCGALNAPLEKLFTNDQMVCSLESNKKQIEVDAFEMMSIIKNSTPDLLLENKIDYEKLPSSIDSVLDTLTPREKEIIKMRFGIEGDEKTLEEVAEKFDISRQCVRMIEKKALWKLRHSSKSNLLKDYLTP